MVVSCQATSQSKITAPQCLANTDNHSSYHGNFILFAFYYNLISYFCSKPQHTVNYKPDGTGRDYFIYYNNGGFYPSAKDSPEYFNRTLR
jgi:hypothetical protein